MTTRTLGIIALVLAAYILLDWVLFFARRSARSHVSVDIGLPEIIERVP